MEQYVTQMKLPEVGSRGQKKLAEARVLVVGAGGLGCAVLPYLAGAGVGHIGIIDGDRVSRSNLHRQWLFNESHIGLHKASIAADWLSTQNPAISLSAYPAFLAKHQAIDLFQQYQLVVDATDQLGIRYLINDACILTGMAFVHASVYKFEAQLSVFNFKGGPSYRCLYPSPPTHFDTCDPSGVLGTTVAIAGAYQAHEVLKIILGIGEILSGKLLLLNTLTARQQLFSFPRTQAPDHITLESFSQLFST